MAKVGRHQDTHTVARLEQIEDRRGDRQATLRAISHQTIDLKGLEAEKKIPALELPLVPSVA